jgi:hypothetical protein
LATAAAADQISVVLLPDVATTATHATAQTSAAIHRPSADGPQAGTSEVARSGSVS